MKKRLNLSAIDRKDVVKFVLAIVYISLIFVPLVIMFSHITPESIRETVYSPNFFVAVRHSITAALIATVVTVILSYALAYCTQRVQMKGKMLIEIVITLPMLVPTVSHGMGLIFLFGNSGFFTRIFGTQSFIYGLPGIVIGSVLYSLPIAYLMFADVMKYEDYSQYEAADILGVSKFKQFTQITFPYIRKPLISVIFTVFTLVITDYGVPMMIGGKYTTLPVILYQEVIGRLNFSKGAVCGIPLLIPALILFLFDAFNKENKKSGFITRRFELKKSKAAKGVAYIFCGVVSILLALPIFSFILTGFMESYPQSLRFTFENFHRTFQRETSGYMLDSILIAVSVAAIGCCVSFMTAYMSARMSSKSSKILHLAAITSTAIPGVVLGLSYVLTFKGTFIYETLAIFIMVNMVHFISSPYLMIYNSLSKLNQNLENVGHTLGIPRMRIMKDVLVPMCRDTLLEMFGYFFINCMTTISAVSFLASAWIKPVSLMINQFEAQMQFECAAVVSIAILVVNLLMKSVIYALKKKSHSVSNINAVERSDEFA